MSTPQASHAIKFPWYEHPFQLISWKDMNEFSADIVYRIGCLLGNTIQAMDFVGAKGGSFPDLTGNNIYGWLRIIENECGKVSLIQSSKATRRLLDDLTGKGISAPDIKVKLDDLEKLIGSEMESQLFFWVPYHRAHWYSKTSEEIVGAQCCQRFPITKREIEEAAKCLAFGQYTASAFHLSRSTEAGVRGLAKAIKFKPPNNHWQLVFQKISDEFKTPPAQRPKHWKTHGKFLTETVATLDAVAKAWRNDIAHLEDFYDEPGAAQLMAIIPIFLCGIAKQLDENGTLY